MRILTVDDSEAVGRTMVLLLGTAGHEARWAGTAADALILVKEWDPAVILMDKNLPDADGLQLARKLKKATEARVIMVSGDPIPPSKMRSLDGFLMKPAGRTEILRTVEGTHLPK